MRRHAPRREALPREKARLLLEEEGRCEDLEKKLRLAVGEAFLDGMLYFRGRPMQPRTLGGAFASALHAAATRILPDLYPHFTEVAITDREIEQLLERHLAGPSTKFMEGPGALGILALDAGQYVASCTGAVPARIMAFVEEGHGASGATLLSHFGGPPYGYPVDVVRACLAGLLRAGKVRIRAEGTAEITSVNDPGTRDLFRRDRDLRRADVFPAREGAITPRDRVAIRSFFKKALDTDLSPTNDEFADAAFQHFPAQRERLRALEERFDRLPGRPPLPPALERLGRALEDAVRSRHVEATVLALKRNLDVLADGLEQLGILRSELTDEAIAAVTALAEVGDVHLTQLAEVGALTAGPSSTGPDRLESAAHGDADGQVVLAQLEGERPWRAGEAAAGAAQRVRARYAEARKALILRQSSEAEAARARVRARAGFRELEAREAHDVLRPVGDALFDTTADAVAPSLAELGSRFPARLSAAEERAHLALDDLLSLKSEAQVVKLEPGLRGREVASREELQALLRELEERLLAQLERGARIRLV